MINNLNVRLHQLNPIIGDIKKNTRQIINALKQAEQAGIDLLIVSELSVCGYPPLDLLERPAFLNRIAEANKEIIEATGETAIIFGTVTRNQGEGRPCFNAALMAHQAKKVAEVHKTLLPTYDVFDEDRYFERNRSFDCVQWSGYRLGITICEDIWHNCSSVQYHTYAVNPVQELADKGADGIINISASPFTDTKSVDRQNMLEGHANRLDKPVFYVNQVGANTDLISDGDSMVLNGKQGIVARAPLFDEACIDVKWTTENAVEAESKDAVVQLPGRIPRIFGALKKGLKEYIDKTGVTTHVVLGLSGGIDSSLVACIAVEALGAENVMGVAMPSEFSSEGSRTHAQQLAQNLSIEFQELPIKSIYREYLDVLQPLFDGTDFGVAEENLQSRARGMLLMAISNKFNRFVLNTGNKSEMAVGYCTLYGDVNGALAVIADVYKTEVFALAQWLNESYYKQEVIPQEVIEKPPSAELRPDQKDSDSLPAYDKLDNILKLYIEDQICASEIVARGFERSLIDRIVTLIHQNEYKRYQAPPILKIHNKAFGSGRRWPIVHHWNDNISG